MGDILHRIQGVHNKKEVQKLTHGFRVTPDHACSCPTPGSSRS